MIELATGALFVASVLEFGLTFRAAVYAALFWVLVVLTAIDLERHLLPDVIVIPALVAGLCLLTVDSLVARETGRFDAPAIFGGLVAAGLIFFVWPRKEKPGADEEQPPSRWWRLAGPLALIGWAALLFVALVSPPQRWLAGALVGCALYGGLFLTTFFFSPRGIGGGDVKLSLVLGAFLGYLGAPAPVLVGLFLSFLSGSILGAIPRLLTGGGRKTRVPFGPFLALGTVIAIFFGRDIASFYESVAL